MHNLSAACGLNLSILLLRFGAVARALLMLEP
jgi:hypothetical protein